MHQYLFYIGDFPIRAYGVVISLSILLATGVGYFLAKADGRGYEKHVADIGIYCGIAGLLGAPTGGSFGILYPESTLAYHTYGAQALWPAEVWEGQLDIVIFALLLAFRAYGQCFALYVMLYSGVRFLLEYFRGDYTEKYLGLFTSAQTGALAFGLLALAAFIWLGFRKGTAPVPVEPHAPEERRKKGKHRK